MKNAEPHNTDEVSMQHVARSLLDTAETYARELLENGEERREFPYGHATLVVSRTLENIVGPISFQVDSIQFYVGSPDRSRL